MERNFLNNFKTKDLTLIALLATIVFVQEQMLTFLPNVQLTVFLLVLYSKKLGFIRTSILCLIHVLLDNMVMGSFNILYMPFMFVGWMIIPITLNSVFKKVESNIILAFLGIFYAFIYSWIFIIPNCIMLNVGFNVYLMADFIWEILLALSSFLSILLLYDPCSKIFNNSYLKRILSKEE